MKINKTQHITKKGVVKRNPPKTKQVFYCESCGEGNLKKYVIDSLGSVFCSEDCFEDSLEYRKLKSPEDVNIIKKVPEIKLRSK